MVIHVQKIIDMKKIYMTPEMEIVELDMLQPILTSSLPLTDTEIDNSEDYNEVSEENSEEALEDTEVMEDDKGYTIRHVDSEEEANWVMPSHCTDLTCYGEDEEFVACTSFRMIETLDENTPRVSSR